MLQNAETARNAAKFKVSEGKSKFAFPVSV